MKNYKLNFLLLLMLMFFTNMKAVAQKWTITGSTLAVCPGQKYTYKATPPPSIDCGNGSCTPDWVAIGAASITKRQYEVDIVWSNTSQLGQLKFFATGCASKCTTFNTSFYGQITEVSINSLAGRQPNNFIIAGENGNQAITSFSSQIGDVRSLSLSVDKMVIYYTNNEREASRYEWKLPTNWSITAGINTQSIQAIPDRCSGGTIKVRGVIIACGNPNDPQGNYYSEWLEIPVTRTIPAIATFTASPAQVECGSTSAVSLSASSVSGATSYTWSVSNTGWAFANSPNSSTLTTTTPNVSVIPTNASGASVAVTVTVSANFGCSATQVATKTVNITINPTIPAPINTNLPSLCQINDVATLSIGNGDGLTTYDWTATGGVSFLNNGVLTNSLSNIGGTVTLKAIADGAGS